MTEKTLSRTTACTLALLLGCDARTLIGEVPDGAAPPPPADGSQSQTSYDPVGTSGHTCSPPQFPGDHPFDFPAGVEGTWTGYVEGGTLGLTSDAIRLVLDHAADGTSQIHVVYGVAAPPGPATSATDFYPPGLDPALGPANATPVEGFPYTAHNIYWDAFGQQWRLRFLKNQAEPWASWCRLQSSYATTSASGTEYGCLPNTGYRSATSGFDAGAQCAELDSSGRKVKDVSCAQVELCLGNFLCGCDECGCDMQVISYDGVPSGPDIFDILFDATAGTASGGSIQLMRAAP